MDYLQRAIVSLIIQGEDLDPDELTALLGRQPESSEKMGETVLRRNGAPRVATTGSWRISDDYREPPDIDAQIIKLLSGLPEDLSIWSKLSARFECIVALGIWFVEESWTAGIALKPQTIRMLGERGLAIDFDMYAPAASK